MGLTAHDGFMDQKQKGDAVLQQLFFFAITPNKEKFGVERV
jgi:hypothetical protein